MPQRYMIVPEPVTFIDPNTKEPMKDKDGKAWEPLTFKALIERFFSNPKWNENYKNTKSLQAIEKALENANGVVQLAQEDWEKLKDCAENPKTLLGQGPMGPIIQSGWGFHPSLNTQLIPLLDAIVEAKDTPPPTEEPAKA